MKLYVMLRYVMLETATVACEAICYVMLRYVILETATVACEAICYVMLY